MKNLVELRAEVEAARRAWEGRPRWRKVLLFWQRRPIGEAERELEAIRAAIRPASPWGRRSG